MADIPVFCLSGLKAKPYTRMDDNALGGQLFTAPYTRRDILYQNNFPSIPAIDTGVEQAYDQLRKATGPRVGLGHSEGGEALERLLRDPGMDLDPDKVVFVISGNPERKYGGIITSGAGTPAYGGVGIPPATRYRVWDISRQYDHFADYPDKKVPLAIANAKDAKAVGIHLDYSGVRVGDPVNVKHVEGNITWEMQPTFPMPSCRKLFWRADREALEDRKIRAQVESGYSRPFVVPTQTVQRYSATVAYNPTNKTAVRITTAPLWNPFGLPRRSF